MIRRRQFITLLGGAAAAWPLAASAQQPAVPVVGYLSVGSPEEGATGVAAFRKGLSEAGHVEGQNVAIEYRWAQGERERLPGLAADLVRRRVAVIAAQGPSSAQAAKALTTTIPIIFHVAGDPVEAGLVTSLSRPGGNLTGISGMNLELTGKRIGLLHELLPEGARFAVLVNPNSPNAQVLTRETQAAGAAIGRHIEVLTAATNRDIDAAFAAIPQKQIDALVVHDDTLFLLRRTQVLALAARYAVPVIYSERSYAESGGLMSYGTGFADRYRQFGIYTGRILTGVTPADLPVLRPTKFELVINLQTARTLGIAVPPTLLAIADEVIE
jgi:putative ABC transport system substrate-binding protein